MKKGRILLCAATSFESRACRQGVSQVSDSGAFEILRTGMGLERAARTLKARLKDPTCDRPSYVISTGFAGTPTDQAQLGTWILGTSVTREGASPIFLHSLLEPLLKRSSLRWSSGRFHSVGDLKGMSDFETVGHPNHSAAILPGAVEMESYSLAEVCQDFELPFDILRVVSDTPGDPIPEWMGPLVSAGMVEGGAVKAREFIKGAWGIVCQPQTVKPFLVRSHPLPLVLSEGWKQLAQPLSEVINC